MAKKYSFSGILKKVACACLAACILLACGCNNGNSGESGGDGGEGNNTQTQLPTITDSNAEALYSVYYYTGEGASQVEPATGLKAGAALTSPKTPTKKGYQFRGWYTDFGTYEKQFKFEKMPAQNVILYAKWEKERATGELQDYEDLVNSTSQNGHLYIHYLRFDNDPAEYAKMSLWVWPKAYTGRTFNWTKDQSGAVVVDELGGAVCDIDLTVRYTDAGNNENQTMQFFKDGAYGNDYKPEYINDASKYKDPEIGFLVVYDESKNSGKHWQSDGGNQYFTISGSVRENGSIHVFAVQDNVGDFVFSVVDKSEITNPYENDDGTHVSKSNVNSSAALPATADPANLFDTVSGVGYQIMVASFADSDGDGYGDIRGIIENIKYIEDLNVNVLWLTPIQQSDSYHGYDIIDYCSVDPRFGTLDDYKELLRLCHSKGIKVIMDLVLNHTSLNNVWFQKSAKMVVEDGVDYRSFYHWRNHEKEQLSSAWYSYSEYAYSYYAKFASGMPELNYDYQPTRDAILNVSKFWMTLLGATEGVDGFRIDAVKHIYMADEVTAEPGDIIIEDFDAATNTNYDTNVTKNLNFFCWLIDGIKKINPNAYVVGENFDGHAYRVAPYYKAFDGMLDFYMYYNLGQIAANMGYAAGVAGLITDVDNTNIAGKNTGSLYKGAWSFPGVLETAKRYGNQVTDSVFTSNHDIPRLMNNVAGTMNKSDWVAGTITDQNAAEMQGRAITTLATMMMLPGISWIYYGDELGMSSNYGAGESKTSPHVDRQYRQPFKWTTKAEDSKYITNYSISGDKTYYVEWDNYNATLAGAKEQNTEGSFLSEVKKWTNLKSNDEVIRYGDYKFKAFGAANMFSFTRTYNGKTYWVVCNFGPSEYQNAKSVFGNGAQLVCASKGASLDYIPAQGCVVAKIAG